MKKIKQQLFICTLLFSVGLLAQKPTQPSWDNHANYKEEVIAAMKKSPSLISNMTPLALDKNVNQQKATFPTFPFVNGVNIAWVDFGKDVGKDSSGNIYHPNMTKFIEHMDSIKKAGGNVIRWWYHVDGSTNPVFENNGNDAAVAANPDFFAEDVKKILQAAADRSLKVQICLWSFDMLKSNPVWMIHNPARNKLILTSDWHRQKYIDNALIPLVNAVGNHPGLYAWEIFNEPEGMTIQYAGHWPNFAQRVEMKDIQRTINWTASAIKTAQPGVKVTSGALGFLSSIANAANGYVNEYTDAKLIAAGGKANGTLDFYNIHYYDWAGINGSPLHNDFATVNLDKPTIIAEYYPQDTYGVSRDNLGTTLKNRGWNGSMVWSFTDRPWTDMETLVKNIAAQTQTNPPNPAGTCSNVSNASTNFALRNAWSDQNIGSSLTNVSTGLKITHRRWGKTDLSLISNGKYQVKAGKQYTISFYFKDNAALRVNKIEVGFASGFDANGAILTQPIVNSTTRFSTTYKKHTTTITANSTGQIQLALKLVWLNQPNVAVAYQIKNISICEKTGAKLEDSDDTDSSEIIALYPNPSTGLINLNAPIASTFQIFDMKGQQIQEGKTTSITTLIDLQSKPKGIYLIKLTGTDKDTYKKIIIK
jgi:Secretion system C-terminal sorting domain